MGMLVQIARAENSKILLNKTQSQTRRQHRDLILIRDSWHPPGYLSLLTSLAFLGGLVPPLYVAGYVSLKSLPEIPTKLWDDRFVMK